VPLSVVFHPDASKEYLAQIAYYDQAVKGLGARFESAQHEAIERIVLSPHRYPMVADPDIRRLSLKIFPFDVIYRIRAEHIQVLAIASHRREHRYWEVRARP
jgi:toxin ParE1/3/4